MKNKYFDEVDTKVDFAAAERLLVDKWYVEGVVDKYLHKNDKNDKYFSFVDGPITANNPMGVHHAWGRTYKDLWQRYKNMQGYRQRFQNGFDAQGLWVEVEVEKDLGFKSKKDIEVYGIDKFVEKCKERVVKYSQIQTQQSKRLGYFMDWDHSYYTMSDENNYTIWHFLKVCHENGWLYKGNESVPWCPRCETAISQHEILTENYKEVVHKSIYFELPIEGRDREFLLVWTTTPWTLPANIAVAVDPDMEYSLISGHTRDRFWVATGVIERVFKKDYKTVKTVKGSDLVGLRYSAPFDHLPIVQKVAKENPDKFHVVIATDQRIMPITIDEGTGLVHTAVSAGTEDFRLGKKLGLPMIPVIADDATYFEGMDFLTGKNVKENPEIILDYLTKEDQRDGVDWVFLIEDYKHRYPSCWRCKTELVWKVTDEWYIAMDRPSLKASDDKSSANKTLRERMIDGAQDIVWSPSFGWNRELDWLKNMHVWLISKKNRYWGLSLPIWECSKCNHFEVIGSKEELKTKAVDGWESFEGKSPHKPQIDEIKLRCPKCENKMSRIEPVGNPWLDAGIVPFSTISRNNSDTPLFQSDLDEWKKWFPADLITESFPGQFKNWFYSLIAMSSVLQNEMPTRRILGYATLLDETGRPMHKSWGNSIEFNEGADKMGVDVMRWIYAKQSYSENLLFGYNLADEVRRQFHLKIWNTYNYFVTYANLGEWTPDRSNKKSKDILDIWILARLKQVHYLTTKHLDKYNIYKPALEIEEFVDDLSNWYIRRSRNRSFAEDKTDRDQFFGTLYYVLIELMKLMAPFMPFLTDQIFTNLTKLESVHLADWSKEVEPSTHELQIIDDMRQVRLIVELGHAVRKDKAIPVRQPLSVAFVNSLTDKFGGDLVALIMDELNVKKVTFNKSKEIGVTLDTTITPELEEEARVRGLIRAIQNERKKIGVEVSDHVSVKSDWLPQNKEFIDLIKQKTLSDSLEIGTFAVKKIK